MRASIITGINDTSLINDNSSCPGSDFLIQYSMFTLLSQVGLIALVSILVSTATCFMQKRNRYQKYCSGFPGLPSPMNFLITPRYRWIYIALFFVMAAFLINTYSSLNNFTIDNLYLKVFYTILILPIIVITVMTIQFFPLFVCVDVAPFPISAVAHSLGLIYSFLWFSGVLAYEANTYLQLLNCDEDGMVVVTNSALLGAAISEDTPLFLTGGYIVMWYLYHFIQDIVKVCLVYRNVDVDDVKWLRKFRQRLGTKKPSEYDASLTGVKYYHIEHVKCMLMKPPPPKEYGKVAGVFVKIFKYFFPYNHYDRLPVPYLGSVAAISMLLYQFSLRLLSWGAILVNVFSVSYTQRIRPALNLSGPVDEVLSTIIVGFPVTIIVSPLVSTLIVFLLLVHMTGAVSKDIKQVSKYGFSEKLPSTLSIVPGMWKYVGIQIGYALSAWGIYTIIAIIAGLAIALIYICFKVYTDWAISITIALVVPFVFPKLIYYAQYLICRFVFFEDRQGKFISITNRRLFDWFAFILFFYNGIAGVFGAILRALMSSMFGLLLLFRLDRIVLMKGFERYDFGHGKYLGFLYLYTAYNNAVIHVFINLLKNTVANNSDRSKSPDKQLQPRPSASVSSDDDKKNHDSSAVELIEVEFSPKQSHSSACRQVINRWLLAYTLIRNPSLVPRKPAAKQSNNDTSTKGTVKQPNQVNSISGSADGSSHDGLIPGSALSQVNSESSSSVMVLCSNTSPCDNQRNSVVIDNTKEDSATKNTLTITVDGGDNIPHTDSTAQCQAVVENQLEGPINSEPVPSHIDDIHSTNDAETTVTEVQNQRTPLPLKQVEPMDECEAEHVVANVKVESNGNSKTESESEEDKANNSHPNFIPDFNL